MFSRLTGSWIKAITEIFAKISEAVLDRYLAAFALPTNPIRRFYRSRARARAISFSETVSGPCPTEAACRYRWLPTFWTSLAAPSGKASPLKPRSSQNLTQSPASNLCSGSTRSSRPLAAHAPTTQPAGRHHLGSHGEARRRLAPQTAHPSPVAEPKLCRYPPE